MIHIIDKITEMAAHIAAWIIFTIGIIITYEVIMRKFFNSPTIWVDETARFFLVWAVYMATPHMLKLRNMIIVNLFPGSLSGMIFKLLEFLTLSVIAFFSFVALYYGGEIVLESIETGRKTSTMLEVPEWLTQSAIPVGFGLLFIQTIVEFLKLIYNKGPTIKKKRTPV
ncbi:MAG: TRAP transporter small permease [Desulfobacteraceae bacterium]|nr:TRAP transporter small permease [Desulfobacteraceae bacterium]